MSAIATSIQLFTGGSSQSGWQENLKASSFEIKE